MGRLSGTRRCWMLDEKRKRITVGAHKAYEHEGFCQGAAEDADGGAHLAEHRRTAERD